MADDLDIVMDGGPRMSRASLVRAPLMPHPLEYMRIYPHSCVSLTSPVISVHLTATNCHFHTSQTGPADLGADLRR